MSRQVVTWLKNNAFHEFVKEFEGNRFEWIGAAGKGKECKDC